MPDAQAAESSSAPVIEQQQAPEAAPPPMDKWSATQLDKWRKTGETPQPKTKEESAPSKENSGAAGDKPADEKTATDSESDDPQEDWKPETKARWNRILKQRADLKAKVEALEKADKKAEPAPAEKKETPKPAKPKLEDFNTFDEFVEALTAHTAKAAIEADRQAQAVEAEQKRIETANREIAETWEKRKAAARKKHADFDDVAFTDDIPLNPTTDGFLLDSEHGAELLYMLRSDKELGERIQKLGPYATARELTRLELSLTGESKPAEGKQPPPEKKTTSAPKPPTELGGRNTEPADEVEAALQRKDYPAYKRLMNAREMKG